MQQFDRDHAFKGRIGRTREESSPAWDARPRSARGAPNIVIVYMDDMGFSDPGCFGGEIDTPHIDALAAGGLRFNHYTTHPLCSAARAALLTGMNAHAVGTGWLANNNAGYPGYSGEIPLDAATLAETLNAGGYETIMVGKWHNTPTRDCVSGASKTSWPSSRGFDTYYGFMEGEAHYFFPAQLMMGKQLVPIDEYPRDYYTTDDWTNKSIQFIKELRASAPEKPFLLYLAQNAVHAPLQAKPSDLAKYRGRYDTGWTAARRTRWQKQIDLGLIPANTRLPRSDRRVPQWEDTDPQDRSMLAQHMEAYAAMLDCVDQNLGKLVRFLGELGELDNTIIVFSSDNGGTDAGGPTGMFNNYRRFMGLAPHPIEVERANAGDLGGPRSASLYPTGWGEVSNTPFPSFKTYTGGGGRRVSLVISWPARIREGGAIRTQFAHVTDLFPTLIDLAGVAPLAEVNGRPARLFHGVSLASVLFDPAAPSPRTEQYYECWSNRAFYRDGWLARSLQKRGDAVDLDNWTLHNLELDFSESEDVRSQYPQKLTELTDAFDAAAWQNFVYPLDNRDRRDKFTDAAPGSSTEEDQPRTFLPGMQTVHRAIVFPLIASRSFRISVRFAHEDSDNGVLWAIGDPTGGMVMYVDGGRLRFHYNGFGDRISVEGPRLPRGEHVVALEYQAFQKREGRGRILRNGVAVVDWTPMSPTMVLYGVLEGLDIGLDRRGPLLWDSYEQHGAFGYKGEIRDVKIEPGARVMM
ncbi:MAG: sulfatase-like hydrolase/transferase [Betaproteobacteria bacterium]|nr:sulfatase-like hydrolase/transferase [Betaproteobacteria bacterium]